jgi:hypothetical protein
MFSWRNVYDVVKFIWSGVFGLTIIYFKGKITSILFNISNSERTIYLMGLILINNSYLIRR